MGVKRRNNDKGKLHRTLKANGTLAEELARNRGIALGFAAAVRFSIWVCSSWILGCRRDIFIMLFLDLARMCSRTVCTIRANMIMATP